jgi:hypothetical protein
MILTPCRICGKASESSYCKEHASHRRDAARYYDQFVKANDEIAKLYHTAEWKKFRDGILMFNPVCLHLIGGSIQCRFAANVVHHLVSPRKDRSAFTDPERVVACCRSCHAGGQEGETQGYLWLPTRWYNGQSFPHIDSFGQAIRHEAKASNGSRFNSWLNSMADKPK